MNLEEYQKRSFIYKKYADAIYPVLALGEETGEVQGVIAKAIRKENNMFRVDKGQLMSELGDVLWNLAAVCTEYNISLEEVAHFNLDKLEHRNTTNQIVERTHEG